MPDPHMTGTRAADIRTAHVYATSAMGQLAKAVGRLWFADQDPLDPRILLQAARQDINRAIESLGGEEAGRGRE